MTDKPVLTSAMVGLFVLGMLYKGYLGQIKQWIHDKVAESSSSSLGTSALTTNPNTGNLQVDPGNGGPPLQIYG